MQLHHALLKGAFTASSLLNEKGLRGPSAQGIGPGVAPCRSASGMPAEHGLTSLVQLLVTLMTGQQIHRARMKAHQSKRIRVHMRRSGT